MRKLASIWFVLSLLTASFSQVLYPRTASAEDVWVITEESIYEYYIQTDYIKDIEVGFMVPVKLVVNGKSRNSKWHIFRYMDDDNYGVWYFRYKNSSASYIQVRGNKWAEAVLDACVPYAKYAKKYPRKHYNR